MLFVFYVNILTPSIINTKYTVFMPAHCVYSTKNLIYLTLFPSPFLNRARLFLFVNIIKVGFLVYLFLLVVLASILFFLFRFNLGFASFGYHFLVLHRFSYLRWTSNDFGFFPTSVGKSTFNKKRKLRGIN